MPRRRAPIGAPLLAVLLAGCNALSGLDADYRLADARDGEVSADAGDRLAASPPVRDRDASTEDAGRDGGGVGARLDCDDPPPGTVFCSDFEAPEAPWGWSRTDASGGAPTVVPAEGIDGSRALHATLSASSGSRSSSVWTSRNVVWNDGQTLTMSFSFRVMSAGIYAVLGAVQFNHREHGLAIYTTDTYCSGPPPCVDENDQEERAHDAKAAFACTPGAWHHAMVTLTRTGAGFGGAVSVDGKEVYASALNAMPGPTPTTIDLGAGAFYSGSPGTIDVYVDDVLVELN